MDKGFTLIEVLVGVFLLVIIFLGIFGAYRLIAKVIQRSEKKITASVIANEQMERIRNLPYLKVGTQEAELPYAQGILTDSTTTVRNDVSYEVNTKVKLMTDKADGLDEAECDWDYKRAQVSVDWGKGQVQLVTDVAPADQAEEIAVCQEQPGGILSVSAFNAQGTLVNSPLIEVYNASTSELVDSYQPSDGEHDFPLATSTYKVVVSKNEFSTSSTYGSDEVTQPEKPNPVVLEGGITDLGFAIDEVATLAMETLSTWSIKTWNDTFEDESKISEIDGLEVNNGQIEPTTTTGYLYSVGIDPTELVKWDELSWSDSETTGNFGYQLYYATSTDWHLIPDEDLSGNSEGFGVSPVDISALDVNQYPKLKLKGNASTTSTSSPVLEDWHLSWKTSGGTLIGNTAFHLRGAKTIGTNASDTPVYKYSATTTSDGSGQVELYPVEWDSYTFRSAEDDLDLVTSTPVQPVDVAPGSTTTVDLFFESQNSLLLTVENDETLEPVLGASTTLSKVDYNETQYTDEQGQTHFIPLEEAEYNLKISAAGYNSTSTSVTVSGDESETVRLEQVE